jgi:hypothetical protein
MSTRYDILAAKATYQAHCSAHHCRAGKCAERARLLNAWTGPPDSASGRWGIEAGDDERQRRQAGVRAA